MIEAVVLIVLASTTLYIGGLLVSGYRSGAFSDYSERKLRSGSERSFLERNGIARHLRAVRLDVEPLVFVATTLIAALLVFLIFLEIFPAATAPAGLAGLAVVGAAIVMLRELALKRGRQFEAQLVDAIDLMQAALGAGENPREAIRTAADASRKQVREEFIEVLRRLELGTSIDQATSRMVWLYDSEGLRLFTQVLSAKWHAGGDLLVMLRAINRVIRDRLKLRFKITSQLSGARHSLFFVALVPYVLIPMFLWQVPEWTSALTSHSYGPSLLLSAVLLQLLGFIWMHRILRVGLS